MIGKRGFLDTLAETAFLIFCIILIWFLFWTGSKFNEISINGQANNQVGSVENSYLLENYLRMPVQCDGQTKSVIDCWDHILSTSDVKGKCQGILTDPTSKFFKAAGISVYLIQFFDKEQSPSIRCAMSQTGPFARGVSAATQIELPHPDPKKKIIVFMQTTQ